MVQRVGIVLIACTLMVALGCSKDEGAASPPERMRQEAKEAAEAAGEWAAQTRAELVETAEKQIADLRHRMQELKQQARQQGEQAEQKWESDIQPQLEKQLARAEERLDELKESGGEAWEDAKSGLREALEALGDAAESARQRLRTTPNPAQGEQ